MKSRIIRSGQRQFSCKGLDGEVFQATALGNLLKENDLVVGDWVEVVEEGTERVIKSLYPRENEIYRLLLREGKKKVTAANCDVLVILSSVSKPAFKRGIIDRFLVRAIQWQVHPVVVFNKMDEYDPKDFDIDFEEKRLESLGVTCLRESAKFPEFNSEFVSDGISLIKSYLQGRTALFVGQSGVGKSKTISALSDGKVDLKTKVVGKMGKGSHTTTWSELIECEGFSLIDSPGIRVFSLDDINPTELLEYFPDVEEVSVRCKFNDCSHQEGNKTCAFFSGDRSKDERQILLSRLESYQRIFAEVSEVPHWKKADKW